MVAINSLQKLKYDIHTKLPLELYQIHFHMIPMAIWYEYHTSGCAVLVLPINYDLAVIMQYRLVFIIINNYEKQ